MAETIKACFGHAISETDEIKNADDIITKFTAREHCITCEVKYNCLSLASIQAGYGEDKTIERFLQGMKFYSLIARQFKNLQSLPLTEQNLEKMQATTLDFIEELKKSENQKLRESIIEQMTKQYDFLLATAESIKDFLDKLGASNIGGFDC